MSAPTKSRMLSDERRINRCGLNRSRRFSTAPLVLGLLGALAGCASAPERSESPTPLEAAVTIAADAVERAAEALAKGDTELALRLYVEAAEHDPNNADALYEIGTIYDEQYGGVLAAKAYAGAIRIDPTHARALEGLGLRYFADRQPEQAQPLLERAVAGNASLWRSHNALGLIADALGRHDVAAQRFAAALAARPGSATILNNRGYSRYLAGDLDNAERDFRAALTAEPGYDKAWQNLALVHARRGDYQAALTTLQRVVTAHVAANDVGYIAMLRGNFATAERLFAEAIRLSPRYYQTANENAAELRRRRTATLTAVQ